MFLFLWDTVVWSPTAKREKVVLVKHTKLKSHFGSQIWIATSLKENFCSRSVSHGRCSFLRWGSRGTNLPAMQVACIQLWCHLQVLAQHDARLSVSCSRILSSVQVLGIMPCYSSTTGSTTPWLYLLVHAMPCSFLIHFWMTKADSST